MPVAMLVTLATIVTILMAVLLHRKQRGTCSTPDESKATVRRLPPGPATLPVIGNMHQMLWSKPAVFRWIHRLHRDMGTSILCLRLGPVHVLSVTSSEIACEVLRKDTVLASRPATMASDLFTYGYRAASLTPLECQWRKMKRVLASEVLSPALLRRLQGRRAEEADHLVRHVHSRLAAASGGCVDVRHVARHFCGNMVRRLVFGKRHFGETEAAPPAAAAAGPGPDEVEHVDALFTLLNHVFSFSVSDYFPALVGLDLDGHEKVARGVMATFARLHDPIIESRIHEWSKHQKAAGDKRDVADILDVLITLEDAQGQPLLSLDEIKAQAMEIMYATVDNPSNAVEWALAEMVSKPGVMQEAVDELDRVVGRDRLVQESDICKLNYLKSCIRESFRLHPYHPFTLPRVATRDTTVHGYTVPRGSHVIISRVGLGRSSKVWHEPLLFRPERHLNDNGDDVTLSEPDLRFISFGSGRRGCPAVSLGTSVTMMLFARLLQGFTWAKPPNVDRINLQESHASLALAEPLVLQAKPRLASHLYAAR